MEDGDAVIGNPADQEERFSHPHPSSTHEHMRVNWGRCCSSLGELDLVDEATK